MIEDQISVQVFDEFEANISETWLREIVRQTLSLDSSHESDTVSVVIADDETVRELNLEYRGLDENTDVLSFSFEHEGEYYGERAPTTEWPDDVDFVLPPGERSGLGEIIISYPQVRRQANDAGRSVDHELAHMLIHGILHLLGHDHMEPNELALMKAKESSVLDQVLRDE
jgi:probable rRNA maturation factor